MTKKIGLIAIGVLIVLAVFAMSMRRSHMMGGSGSPSELISVSADGTQIPLSEDLISVTGALLKGTASQKSGDMIVSLTLNPYPPSAGQLSKFDVTLTDVSGRAIDDASISLDLTMPTMWMPPNQLTMGFISDGKYHAEGQFTMRGGWRIEVIVTRGSETQSVFFDVGM
jgi:hypothetical protein